MVTALVKIQIDADAGHGVLKKETVNKETVATGLLEAATLTGQMVLGGQRETVEAVIVQKSDIGIAGESQSDAAVGSGRERFANVPRKTLVGLEPHQVDQRGAGFRLTVVAVPEAGGVNVIDEMVTSKVRRSGLAGELVPRPWSRQPRPLPPTPQLTVQGPWGPLQAVRDKAASKRNRRKRKSLAAISCDTPRQFGPRSPFGRGKRSQSHCRM